MFLPGKDRHFDGRWTTKERCRLCAPYSPPASTAWPEFLIIATLVAVLAVWIDILSSTYIILRGAIWLSAWLSRF